MKAATQLIYIPVIILMGFNGCGHGIGIGGAGWDDAAEVETAKRYPMFKSDRIALTAEGVSPGTFRQEFDTVFDDFPHRGRPARDSREQIEGTPYSISYKDSTLKVFRGESLIAERKLPGIFYMHPMSSGVMPGGPRGEDTILCRTRSRATTGLHYVCILSGEGDILYESVLRASEDWDIAPGARGEVIIGGASTKTVISRQD